MTPPLGSSVRAEAFAPSARGRQLFWPTGGARTTPRAPRGGYGPGRPIPATPSDATLLMISKRTALRTPSALRGSDRQGGGAARGPVARSVKHPLRPRGRPGTPGNRRHRDGPMRRSEGRCPSAPGAHTPWAGQIPTWAAGGLQRNSAEEFRVASVPSAATPAVTLLQIGMILTCDVPPRTSCRFSWNVSRSGGSGGPAAGGDSTSGFVSHTYLEPGEWLITVSSPECRLGRWRLHRVRQRRPPM